MKDPNERGIKVGSNFPKLHCFGPMRNVISLDKERRYVGPNVKNKVE
jgi:hypothetical protein